MNKKIKNIFAILILVTSILNANNKSVNYFEHATFDEIIQFKPLLFKDDNIQEDNLEYLGEIVAKIKTYSVEDKNVAIAILGKTSSFLDKIYSIDDASRNGNLEKNEIYSNKIKEYLTQNGIDPKRIFIEPMYARAYLKRNNQEHLSNSTTVTLFVKRNMDNDNDGVENKFDRCPNTKKGHKVGSNGCKIRTMVVLLDGKKKNTSIIVSTLAGSVTVSQVNQFVTIGSPSVKPTQPENIDMSTLALLIETPDNNSEELTYTLYFEENELVGDSIDKAKVMLEKIAKRKNAYIKIIGHTDTVGSMRDNISVSHKRAEVISKMIKDSGVEYIKIDVEGYSESNLAVPTKDNVYEPLNRRVEVFIN